MSDDASIEPYARSQIQYQSLLYNTLASYYISAARSLDADDKFSYGHDSPIEPRSRDELFKEATALVTLAEDIDDQDNIMLTNKGAFSS
jgi:hypothetical protein